MELKLYFVAFAIRRNREYRAYAGYIFAKSEDDVEKLLSDNYGEISIRSINEVKIEEGVILYGERWRTIEAEG